MTFVNRVLPPTFTDLGAIALFGENPDEGFYLSLNAFSPQN
jgi:hypothetical protein